MKNYRTKLMNIFALDDYLTAQQAYVEIAKQYLNNTKYDEQASS